MRVFISFSGHDRDVKNRLVGALKKGIDSETEIWESDEKCISSFSEDCIKGIDGSQVFIVLISSYSMDRASYVLNEVIEAKSLEGKGKLNILIYNVDGSPLSETFRFHLNHVSIANNVAREANDEEAGFSNIINRVKVLLQHRKEGKPDYTMIPEIDALKPGKSTGYFVQGSRDGLFEKITEAFTNSHIVFLEQMDGFGRKSAAKKYTDLFAEQYTMVYYFPLFRGSIRDFLLKGLKINNITETGFELLSEQEKIVKKGEFLSKLNDKTLLIVPEVIIDQNDDQFVLDILSGTGCRIIFITQSVPRIVSDAFPCILVERMSDQHLFELFFHYLHCSNEEKELLKIPLSNFFKSIGGHTKTVELTATTFSDEFIFADQIPEMLEQISSNSQEGISGKVTEAISELLRIKEFDETEQQMLWCASALGSIPCDEKVFIDALKEANCFDAGKLRGLISKKWIDNDRESKLISVNSFLAAICLSKIKPTIQVAKSCCENLVSISNMLTLRCEDRLLTEQFGVFAKVLNSFGMPTAARAAEMVSSSTFDLSIKKNYDYSLIDQVTDEKNSSEYAEAADNLLEIIFVIIRMEDNLASIPTKKSDTFNTRILKNALTSFMEAVTDLTDLKSNETYGLLKTLAEQIIEKPLSAPALIIGFTESFLKTSDSLDKEDIAIFEYLLSNFYRLLIIYVPYEPFFGLKMCEERKKIANKCGGYNSPSEIYYYYSFELQCRTDLDMLDEATRGCYYDATEYFEQSLDKLFQDTDKAYDHHAEIMGNYIKLLTAHGEKDEADKVLYKLLEVNVITPILISCVLSAAMSVALSYIGNGEKEHAAIIINDVLRFYNKNTQKHFKMSETDDNSAETALFLKDMLTELETPSTEEPQDGNVEYQNYYKENASVTDRRAFALFEKIAEKAMNTDYSTLDDKDIIAKKHELECKAKAGATPESLAAEAFALAGEVGYRILGYRHHYVQYLGAAAMIGGNVAEIQNGEGKTYTIPLVAFLYALYGKQVHIVDSSEYLCKRNYGWMRGIYEALGCSVGRINNYKELGAINTYDIIYSTLSNEVFAFLNESIHISSPEARLRRDVIIVDEADLLIDNASQDYTILGDCVGYDFAEICRIATRIVDNADNGGNRDIFYTVNGYDITLGNEIYESVERYAGKSYTEMASKDKSELKWAIYAYIRSKHIFIKGKDYFLRQTDGEPAIRAMKENLKNGILEPLTRYEEFFILTKEGIPEYEAKKVLRESHTLDTVTVLYIVNLFKKRCGTTATAVSVANLFKQYYGMNVLRIPTNLPVRRIETLPRLYPNADKKYAAALKLIQEKAANGQPILVVCESTFESVRFYSFLEKNGMDAVLLNATNPEDSPELLADAGKSGRITVTTALVNRGVDICLAGNHREEAKKELIKEGVDPETLDAAIYGALDADGESRSLRNKYNHLAAVWNMRLKQERAKLEDLGGLCVIGMSCFSDLRVEQQLIGRCARQGNPGESYIFYSYEDNSFKKLMGEIALWFSSFDVPYIDCGKGRIGSLLGRAITKARTVLLENSCGGADKSFDSICLAPMRSRFHDPVYKATEKSAEPKEVLAFILRSTSIFAESIKSLKKKNGAGNSKFISELSKRGYGMTFRSNKTEEVLSSFAIDVLSRKLESRSDLISEVISSLCERTFIKAWQDYIQQANDEFNDSFSIQHKRRINYLTKFTEEYGDIAYSKAADEFMNMLLTLKLEIANKEKDCE